MTPVASPSRFARSTRGTVAVEFAIVLPVLLVMLMLGNQIVAYVNAVRKVESLATSISEMISEKAPTQNSTVATVDYMYLDFATDSALVIFPYLMRDAASKGVSWLQDISINMSGIQFSQSVPSWYALILCPAGANQSPCYTANVVWTTTGATGANYRACGVAQQPMANTAPPNKYDLPQSTFGPGSLVVVDIVFTFHPIFATSFMQPITIKRSVYVQPRYASLIEFNTANNDGIATECPGY